MQNLKICKIQIQGLFKDFQASFLFFKHFQGPRIFHSEFKHFQGFLKHAMNPATFRFVPAPLLGTLNNGKSPANCSSYTCIILKKHTASFKRSQPAFPIVAVHSWNALPSAVRKHC